MTPRATRRGAIASLAALVVGGCDRFGQSTQARSLFDLVNDLSYSAQRLVIDGARLAPEFPASEISQEFRANGSIDPQTDAYKEMATRNFADWRLEIGGLVQKPARFSLADLRAMPARTQITRHDCVEGWSCIGQWTGVPVAHVLDLVRPEPQARFLMMRCADSPDRDAGGGGGSLDQSYDLYYETIDLVDARHPQTIFAYDMNGAPLAVAHGAPLRIRVERQLGYKMAKYIMRVDLVDRFDHVGRGKGGYWEDRGYDWYAGI